MNTPRKRLIDLSPAKFLLAFTVKYALACLYGFIFLRYYGGDDTWLMHNEGLKQAELLRENIVLFFEQLQPSEGVRAHSGFQFVQLYFQDLEYYIQTKALALFSIITGGNYYLNALLFSLVMIWPQYWLYKIFKDEYPHSANLFYALVFLFVPVVFWISGIRSDAWLFLFLSLCLFGFYRWLNEKGAINFILAIIGFMGMLVFRLPFALLMLPALLAWMLHVKAKKRISISFISIYGLFVLLFFGSYYFSAERALTNFLVERQQAFMQLEGKTRFEIPTLTANPVSFLEALPRSLENTLLRPYPGEAEGPLQYLMIIENMLVLAFLGFAIYKNRKGETGNRKLQERLTGNPRLKEQDRYEGAVVPVVLLMFAATLYVLIGWIAPFPGAIIRYRAIPELLLLAAFIMIAAAHIKKNNIR